MKKPKLSFNQTEKAKDMLLHNSERYVANYFNVSRHCIRYNCYENLKKDFNKRSVKWAENNKIKHREYRRKSFLKTYIPKKKVSRFCSLENCNSPYWSKGYCQKHYAKLLRTGNLEYIFRYRNKICKIKNCKEETKNLGLCRIHFNESKRLNTNIKGKNNPNWKGGISIYPNHYEMKLNRKIKIKMTNNLCEICGEKGKHIHHKDFSKN
ncbi:unnamed protein product, partial [marine sediment metagenome]